MLVEIDLGRGAYAVGALAQEDAVEVLGEDLFLGEFALDSQCEEDFLELAAQRPLGGEDRIARELHRDRAAALADAAGRHVGRERTHQALPVHAGMMEEPVVLGREERVHDDLRDLFALYRDAALLADLCDQLAVARVDRERQLHPELAQLGCVRQFRFQVLVRSCDAEADQRDGR